MLPIFISKHLVGQARTVDLGVGGGRFRMSGVSSLASRYPRSLWKRSMRERKRRMRMEMHYEEKDPKDNKRDTSIP